MNRFPTLGFQFQLAALRLGGRHARAAAGGRPTDPAALSQCTLQVGRCRLNRAETSVESAWCQLLKLKHDKLLSSFAFHVNLRRYIADLRELVVGPGRKCPPRHPPHLDPRFLS